MTPQEDNLKIFADPELKAALIRAFPAVRAPQSLQARIQNLIEDEAAAGAEQEQSLKLTLATGPSGWRTWVTSGRRLAVAACIGGLVLGIGLFALTQNSGPGTQIAVNDRAPIFVASAVAQHDELGQSVNDAQFRQMLRSAPQMRDQLRQDKVTLPVVDLSKQGWEFVGAKPSPKDGRCLGQMLYTRGKQSLSVVVFTDDQAAHISANCVITQGHIVAIRKIANGVVCVVGYCPTGELPQSEVENIASRFTEP